MISKIFQLGFVRRFFIIAKTNFCTMCPKVLLDFFHRGILNKKLGKVKNFQVWVLIKGKLKVYSSMGCILQQKSDYFRQIEGEDQYH